MVSKMRRKNIEERWQSRRRDQLSLKSCKRLPGGEKLNHLLKVYQSLKKKKAIEEKKKALDANLRRTDEEDKEPEKGRKEEGEKVRDGNEKEAKEERKLKR
ncbi:hypothetical protein NL676_034857 [Syzygium grande]|nr:hypothetical protein NL676_034857 [Syzygium grande]